MSIYRIARALPFSALLRFVQLHLLFPGDEDVTVLSHFQFYRQLEKEAETVISVLRPGPLGIIEHKSTPQEILQAKATVCRSVDNWPRHSNHANGVLNHFIYK
ncbi:hypothetical protein IGI04_014090 [Brassica rapa subsp. trilocularis]|uniref:Uncharacterized protein n=1 Tax=Brassica rapa subsp. trilocularis TaxID=1813537 RepID=A0ABQ7ML64_BRACM|nr:hypothetical protein IGI04_014090 [Brassica rapa subsp. trilocularis]